MVALIDYRGVGDAGLEKVVVFAADHHTHLSLAKILQNAKVGCERKRWQKRLSSREGEARV